MRYRYSTEGNGKPVKKAVVYTQDEHKINFPDVDPQAVYIIERLKSNGYETYIVGGAVRDLILGKKPKDFDIVTAASPVKIKRIFRNSRVIGRRFRLVHVYFGPKIIEVSTFRSMKDGPTSNTFGTVEEDVLRRDFSLNALFYDPSKQIVVDYVGAMKDIKKRVIRPIISLSSIFTDDPVRMIRAVKYGAMAGFKLPFSLRRMIRRHSELLAGISPSRLTEEIFKIIHSPRTRQIVEGLDSLGLYCYLQPNAARLFKTRQPFREKYLQTMDALNCEGFKNLQGEALAALIRDYLDDEADWDGRRRAESIEHSNATGKGNPGDCVRPLAERYKSVFALARKFVLPMNPPRVELDSAVRLLFAEHGVPIKRTRFYEHSGRIARGAGRQAGSGNIKDGDTGEDRGNTAGMEKDLHPTKPDKELPRNRQRRRRNKPQEPSSEPSVNGKGHLQ